jgi:DNA-binding NtrC family response regulator
LRLPNYFDAAHCFSIFYQIDRAFLSIFSCIIGQSMAMSRLRAAIWESIFTHNMRRYVRGVYRSMADITTLITGPSGTGKELVAQAIGLSRYQLFEPRKQRFVGAEQTPLLSLNLSALAETIIESELFGHRKGAFTGAVEDRIGWLEACPAEGCVFLDEIGEMSEAIQVKLLRVMQTREFNRLGETKRRRFEGKFIAATNRDLQSEIETGRFRGDLYYRMCADLIQTPSLREQLQESPEDLELLVRFAATRLLSALPDEVDGLAEETIEWIDRHLGSDYAWPGNIRELEQCVRNVLIRKSADSMPAGVKSQPQKNAAPTRDYASRTSGAATSVANSSAQPVHGELQAVIDGSMTLAEVEEWYTHSVYQRLGQYDLTAERLKINWRTVKAKVKQYAKRQSRHAADE